MYTTQAKEGNRKGAAEDDTRPLCTNEHEASRSVCLLVLHSACFMCCTCAVNIKFIGLTLRRLESLI